MNRFLISAALLTACSQGGQYIAPPDLTMVAGEDLTMPPPADMTGQLPDLTMKLADLTMPPMTDMTVVQKKPVGSTCAGSANCSGLNAQCYMGNLPGTVLNVGNPGYCSNNPCGNDNDCGNGGFCTTVGAAMYCLGSCTAPGQCAAVNVNNRCYFWDNTHSACLPASFSSCDPTSGQPCAGGACARIGFDNVGSCETTCTFGAACPNDSKGNAQNCYFANERVDAQGNATGDFFAGLVCLGAGTTQPNLGCTFIDDCTSGYECDFYMLSGQKLCKKQCRKGTTDCNGVGGTCQDAFKLGANFVNNAIGLCI